MFRHKFKCFLLLAVFCSTAGCGDLFESHDPPVSITGRVTYLGQPLTQGTIVFSKDAGFCCSTDPITAALNYDGSFTLNEPGTSGIRPGFYRIVISGTLHNGYLIPRRYHDPETSGLHCKVEPGQPLLLSIELN